MTEQRHDPFEFDDAAYVLGALEPAERSAFEGHLATCAACRARVAELAPLPPRLATVAPDAAFSEVAPGTLLPRLLREARRIRVRRRWLTAATGLVAAAVVTVLVLVVRGRSPEPPPVAAPLTLRPVAATQIHATAALTGVRWGTKIELTCTYELGYPRDDRYELVVTARDGHQERLGTWKIVQGRVTTFVGGTALTKADIAKVLVTDVDGPTVLQLDL